MIQKFAYDVSFETNANYDHVNVIRVLSYDEVGDDAIALARLAFEQMELDAVQYGFADEAPVLTVTRSTIPVWVASE